MADIYSPEKRSEIMSRVRTEGTVPEQRVQEIAHSLGFVFQRNRCDLPGKPDLVFPEQRKVIQVHGCFWHWHGCCKSKRPKSNNAFWEKKLARNVERDHQNAIALRKAGWQMLVIWECETKDCQMITKSLRHFLEYHADDRE